MFNQLTATTTASPTLNGPRALPWIGPRLNLAKLFGDPITYLTKLHGRFGPVATITGGDRAVVSALGPVYNQQVLLQGDQFLSLGAPFTLPAGSASARLNRGLIFMNGAEHRHHRKLVTPAFHKQRIEGYQQAMITTVDQQLAHWPTGQTVDLMPQLQRLVNGLINQVLFGLREGEDGAQVGALVQRYVAHQFSPLVMLAPYDRPGLPFRRLLQEGITVDQALRQIIATKRAAGLAGNDILSLLINAHSEAGDGVRHSLSDDELIGHLTIFFFAAHDTTVNALGWTLFLLSQHPAILADLVDELDGTLHGDAPTLAQLSQLPLLDRVIKESLRILSPFVMAIRASSAAFVLDGHGLPAGTQVCVSPALTHHLPDLYADPQRFHPARWETLSPPPGAYLPFGAGAHGCIGAALAMMELRIVLAMLLPRYRLTLAANARIDRQVSIIMSPRHGLPMTITPQDRAFGGMMGGVRGNIQELVRL